MNSDFEVWQQWERSGILPFTGGYLEQPLPLLIRINAIDLVYKTKMYMKSKDSDWSKLTKTQIEIVRWIEG